MSVSPNGLVFIFQNSKKKDKDIHILELDIYNETFGRRQSFNPIRMINDYLDKFL